MQRYAVLFCSVVGALPSVTVFAQPVIIPSRVFLNGIPTPVHFNDGDSFRILSGKYAETRCRLGGFNTLESFGPVHRWGDWNAKELFTIAKMATLNARRGVWHCTSDLSTDTYGRMLWTCPDLIEDQIRRGLAHAMSIDDNPADEKALAAQADAIRNRRGIWAHGVPSYVVTSVHSSDEGGGDDEGRHYNRIVSTTDGHSASFRHRDTYSTCDWYCTEERSVDDRTLQAAIEAFKSDPEIQPHLADLPEHHVTQIVEDYARLGWFANVEDQTKEAAFQIKLDAMQTAGTLTSSTTPGACMRHVPYKNQYGRGRAACLDEK